MKTIIYYRDDYDWQQEKDAATRYFGAVSNRVLIPHNHIVIPRFSALPFYKELEWDIEFLESTLINSYKQHQYVADLMNWYEDLKDFTPKTWEKVEYIPDDGPFVLKGATNSKKFLWKTHMFAANRMDAIEVYSKLMQDSMISYQNIYVREYVPLKQYDLALQDLPITKEFRFFFYKEKLLTGAYYWSNHIDDLKEKGINPDVEEVPKDFLKKIASIVSQHINFYVVDIAQTENDEWIVIELNDGSMSGLSCNDPEVLYKNLSKELEKE